MPWGAQLTVGTGASSPLAVTRLPPRQPAAALATGNPTTSSGAGTQSGTTPVGDASTTSTTSCVSALSGVPQSRPGGAYYDFHCQTVSLSGATVGEVQGTTWVPNAGTQNGLPAAVPLPPVPPPPQVLAREAADELLLPAPRLEMSPAADRDQVVGFPTWLWLDPGSFSPRTRTVAVPGESVTARAVPVSTSWVLGDGSTLTCAGAGTPYTPGGTPAAASPDCGHTYLRPSLGQPGGRYPVTVTTRWQISWAGAGQAGVLPELSRTAAGSLRVAEVQTLNS